MTAIVPTFDSIDYIFRTLFPTRMGELDDFFFSLSRSLFILLFSFFVITNVNKKKHRQEFFEISLFFGKGTPRSLQSKIAAPIIRPVLGVRVKLQNSEIEKAAGRRFFKNSNERLFLYPTNSRALRKSFIQGPSSPQSAGCQLY